MPARRLVLLFDGTWNKREDTTNVWRLKTLLRHVSGQLVYYDEGVGTEKGEKLTGGALGRGLSRKVLHGYLWLMENYEDAQESETGLADEVFIFGFSRGAYTARSLVGLLSIAGLLHRDAATRVRDAFEISRLPDISESHYLARTFRAWHSRIITIRLLAVWDTVGALGVPEIEGIPRLFRDPEQKNAEHKVLELPSIVQHARHAMAVDEKRKIFEPTLWPSHASHQTLEQRWFVGAHANVGGGYERDGLFARPLQWLQTEGILQGLQFRSVVRPPADGFYTSAPRESLDEIFYGGYYLTQKFKPFARPLLATQSGNETIDYTVLERWLWSPNYRPPELERLLIGKPGIRPQRPQMLDTEIGSFLLRSPVAVSATRGYSF
jgi:hypothetical protein